MINIDNICMGCMSKKDNDEAICSRCGYDSNITIDKSIYLKPGTVINNYLFGRVLGHGGFGITYIGMNVDSGEVDAIKEYFPTGQTLRSLDQSLSVYTGKEGLYKKGLEKFKEEAELLKKFVGFPGIVESKDYFECNNTAYFVMEYVEGITFKEYVEQKGGSIPFSHVREILMPIMDALGEMHRYGIIHRDISPDNIYITVDKRIKLLDFGSARYANNEDNKSLSIIIKHGYAPKEQYYTKGNQGPWTDVYAVATTAYYALTGQTPQTSLERMEKDHVVHPSRIGADISIDEEQVLMVAMSINETDRYQNMKSFQKSILKVRKDKTAAPKSTAASQASTNIDITKAKTDSKREKKYFTINKKVVLIASIAVIAVAAITLAVVFLPNIIQPKNTEVVVSGKVDEDIVVVPNLMAMSEKEALNTLKSAKLNCIVKYEYCNDVMEGSVIRQSVPAYNTLSSQSTLTIFISLGAEQDAAIASETPEPTLEATPQPTGEATPEPTEKPTSAPADKPTAKPTQKPTPEVTPVQTEWSAWSEWYTSQDEMLEIVNTQYWTKEIEFENQTQGRKIIKEVIRYHYKTLTVNWSDWIENTEGLTYEQVRAKYPYSEYRLEFVIGDNGVIKYKKGEITAISDWSEWMHEADLPSDWLDENKYICQGELDRSASEWSSWRVIEEGESDFQDARDVWRFKWREYMDN